MFSKLLEGTVGINMSALDFEEYTGLSFGAVHNSPA